MALILLRHTRPAEADGLCYGRFDPPLGAAFPAEAEALARTLPPVATIATSPSARCLRLAEAIAAARALEAIPDPDLAEIDFGAWENRPWDAIPRSELDAWAADLHHARPHGGETVAELRARTARALARWRARRGPVLLVTHAGVIRAARDIVGQPRAWESTIAHGAWISL